MFYSVPLTCRWFFSWREEWTENMGFGPDGGCFDLPTSQTEILEVINFVDSALGQTQRYDWKTPRSAQESHSVSISTSCNHFLHRHKAEPRPERHRLHQEWISYYFPMNSSTHELVRDSQLLRRFKDKSSGWMRTNEIEALKGWSWKIHVAFGLEKHNSHLLTQWNCFQFHLWHGGSQ